MADNFDMTAFRDLLLDNPLYLAHPSFITNICWRKVGRANMVVSAVAATEYDAAVAAAAAKKQVQESAAANNEEQGMDNKQDGDHDSTPKVVEKAEKAVEPMEKGDDKNPETPTERGAGSPKADDDEIDNIPNLEPALLTAVAYISASDCWLTPCGLWKGANPYTPRFAELKLNCRLIPVANGPFATDFKEGAKKLEVLAKQMAKAGNKRSGTFDDREKPAQSIKLRHVVFEEKAKDGSDTGSDTDGTDGPTQVIDHDAESHPIDNGFPIEEWPVKYPAAEEALAKMTNTHIVLPLSAYDVDGDLIPPERYMTKLPGAVVRATFTLTHWHIAHERKDTYSADIVSLRVLVPPSTSSSPTASTSSPRKRRAPPKRDEGSSPMKKPRSD